MKGYPRDFYWWEYITVPLLLTALPALAFWLLGYFGLTAVAVFYILACGGGEFLMALLLIALALLALAGLAVIL